MARPYSLDLRERVWAAWQEGQQSQGDIARRFEVSESFVRDLSRRFRASGSVAPQPHGGGRTPAADAKTLARLQALVAKRSDATNDEYHRALCATKGAISISRATVGRLLLALDLTRKKRRSKMTSAKANVRKRGQLLTLDKREHRPCSVKCQELTPFHQLRSASHAQRLLGGLSRRFSWENASLLRQRGRRNQPRGTLVWHSALTREPAGAQGWCARPALFPSARSATPKPSIFSSPLTTCVSNSLQQRVNLYLKLFASTRYMLPKVNVRIYLKEHFPSISLVDLGNEIRNRYALLYGTRSCLLCNGSALAVVPTGAATVAGRNPENLAVLEKEADVCTFINEFGDVSRRLIFRYDNINFWVPCPKYAVELWLAPRETSGRFLQIKTHAGETQSLSECRLIARENGWSDVAAGKVSSLVHTWALASVFTPSCREECFHSPPQATWVETGSVLSIRSVEGFDVTFPWVELYLQLRYGLTNSELLQYMSFNKTGSL